MKFLLTLIFILTTSMAWSGPLITLMWDSIPDAEGYKVYRGNMSGTYVDIVCDIPSGYTNCAVSGLPMGNHYFAATAYNHYGLESGYSNEVLVVLKPINPPKLEAK